LPDKRNNFAGMYILPYKMAIAADFATDIADEELPASCIYGTTFSTNQILVLLLLVVHPVYSELLISLLAKK
jgi:hypothetical protein